MFRFICIVTVSYTHLQQQLDLEIKLFPAYPASAVQESLSAFQYFATAYTAPAPPRPPCHKAGSSNRQVSSPTGWNPGPGQRMWIGYAYLFIFKMYTNWKLYSLAYVHLLGT